MNSTILRRRGGKTVHLGQTEATTSIVVPMPCRCKACTRSPVAVAKAKAEGKPVRVPVSKLLDELGMRDGGRQAGKSANWRRAH